MTDKRKAKEPQRVDVEEQADDSDTAPTVVVHDYDPVRPHSRRRNDTPAPEWVEQEHPEVDE